MQLNTPRKLLPILEPKRYKGLKGGRGSGKSWFFAQMILEAHLMNPDMNTVCIREVQKSIKFSSKKLIEDLISKFNLFDYFHITQNEIRCKKGKGVIIFQGMQDHTADSIKSLEGFNIAWVEEAQTISNYSLKLLIPTIRADKSEIWFSWNPLNDIDPIEEFFNELEDNFCLIHINYNENRDCPQTLIDEAERQKKANPKTYGHIWLGEFVDSTESSYYGKYLIKEPFDFPIETSLKTYTAWDLGVDDATSIWIFQVYGREIRLIQYYENKNEGLQHYINYLHDFRDKHSIVYDRHFAPHDIAVRELTTGNSRLETARKMGIKFHVTENLTIAEGIQAVRNIIPRCHFHTNATKGFKTLKRYRKEFDEKRNVYKDKPYHDDSSHCADAIRYLALNERLLSSQFNSKPIVNNSDWSVY